MSIRIALPLTILIALLVWFATRPQTPESPTVPPEIAVESAIPAGPAPAAAHEVERTDPESQAEPAGSHARETREIVPVETVTAPREVRNSEARVTIRLRTPDPVHPNIIFSEGDYTFERPDFDWRTPPISDAGAGEDEAWRGERSDATSSESREVPIRIVHTDGGPLFSAQDPRFSASLANGIHLVGSHVTVPDRLPWSVTMTVPGFGFGTYLPGVGVSEEDQAALGARAAGVFETVEEPPFLLNLAFRSTVVATALIEEETEEVVFRLSDEVIDAIEAGIKLRLVEKETRAPIAGATVEVETLTHDLQAQGTSGVDGRVEIRGLLAGPYRLSVRAEGPLLSVERWFSWGGLSQHHRGNNPEPPVMIEGAVVDGNGDPVAGRVRLEQLGGIVDWRLRHFPYEGIVVDTGEDGVFRARVPRDRYSLQLVGDLRIAPYEIDARYGDVSGVVVTALSSTEVHLDFGPFPQVPIWWEIRDAEEIPIERGYVTSRYAHAGRFIPGVHTIHSGVGFPLLKSQTFFVGNDPVEVVLEE